MGADLYINSRFKNNHEKYEKHFTTAVKIRDEFLSDSNQEKEVQTLIDHFYDKMYSKGYFRDSYNCSSMLQTLDLSWWQDVGKLLNKSNELTPTKAKEFLKLIQSASLKLPTKKELIKKGANVDNKKDTLKSWHDMFKKHKQELIDFLNEAIQLKENIRCSI